MATLTKKDNINALQYALNRLTQELCEDPNMLKKICVNDAEKNCLKWTDDDSGRLWPHICTYDSSKKCTSNSDCNYAELGQTCINNIDNPKDPNKYCGFCTNKQKAGNCKINSKKLCEDNSEIPYECTSDGICVDKPLNPDREKQKNYLEWHTDDKDSNGKCIYGNYVAKQYAEYPKSRPNLSEKNLSHIPPPFQYDSSKSDMYITKDYCDYYNQNYGSGSCSRDNNIENKNKDCVSRNNKNLGVCVDSIDPNEPCKADSDCSMKEDKCIEGVCGGTKSICEKTGCVMDDDCKIGDSCKEGRCIGKHSNCWLSTGQVIGEMVIGKTIFNGFSRACFAPLLGDNIKPARKERVKLKSFIEETFEGLNKTPQSITKLSDSKHISTKNLVFPNFAGNGINLYMIFWKPESGLDYLHDMGFDSDEVSKIYPKNVKVIDGKKYISINKSEISKDLNLKRIFLTLNSSKWMFENAINSNKK
jgi:hypothetical protein